MEPWLLKPKSKQRNVPPACANRKDNRNQLKTKSCAPRIKNSSKENIRMYNKLCPSSRLPHSYGEHLKYGVFRSEPRTENASRPVSSPMMARVRTNCRRTDEFVEVDSDDEPTHVPIVVISPRPKRKILNHLALSEIMHVDIKPPVKHVSKSAVQCNKW